MKTPINYERLNAYDAEIQSLWARQKDDFPKTVKEICNKVDAIHTEAIGYIASNSDLDDLPRGKELAVKIVSLAQDQVDEDTGTYAEIADWFTWFEDFLTDAFSIIDDKV